MKGKVQVVNKYKHEPTDNDVYIGRGSLFGNPYSHVPSSRENVTMCDSREDAIQKYKKHFNIIMGSCGCRYKDFKYAIRELIMKLKIGEDINLVCFCKPKTCHGDIIKKYIEDAQ